MFMVYQSYRTINNTLYKDNQDIIKIEKYGRKLCTNNSRYVNIRFFVKDGIDKGELKLF